jgi:hypothetical protein
MKDVQRLMMREPRPWWVKRTGTVNLVIVAALLLVIVWATFFR